MPQDAFTIGYLTRELAILKGAKITKINQPFPDEILLHLYTKEGTRKLILSANPNLCRVSFTGQTFPNPPQALPFQMTLRKHLSNGTVEEVSRQPWERVVRFRVSTRNELSDYEVKFLVIELTGRTANLLLLDGEERVVAALHTSSLESERRILPGFPYSPLTQDKLCPDGEGVASALSNWEGDPNGFLLKQCKGLAKSTALEIASVIRDLSPEEAAERIRTFTETPPRPCVLMKGGEPVEYFAFPYETAGEDYRFYESLSDAIDSAFSEKNLLQRFRDRSAPLRSVLKGQLSKQEKKLQRIEEKLAECAGMEQYKMFGELVTSNLYRLRSGDSELVCPNYYEEGSPEIRIPLDIRLSPAQNAQKYYRRYNKLKTAQAYALSQREECRARLDYLRSVEYAFGICTKFEEIEELTDELREAGYLKRTAGRKKPKKEEKISPFLFACEGCRIAVGKNNYQNDILSFKTARPGDIWLHAKDWQGCHTVVLNPGNREIPPSVILAAAEIAAWYSKADRGSKTVVDYVDKKFLKKPPGSPAGFVTYTNFKSLVVLPNGHPELAENK